MAEKINKLKVEIDGNVKPLEKALKGANTIIKGVENELQKVELLLKFDPNHTELLAQKQLLLTKNIEATTDKLDTFKLAAEQVKEKMDVGKVSVEQYRALQREIISTEQSLRSLESATEESGEKFNLLGDENFNKNIQAASIGIAGELVGALGNAAVQAGVAAEGINNLSKETGLSTDEIQKLQYASDKIGISMDTLTGSMGTLTTNMADAQKGTGDAKAAFEKLGVSFKDDLTGELRDSQEVFDDAMLALSGVADESERNALSMQIFGESAENLNPLIMGGAESLKQMGDEAERTGLIMSEDTLNAANDFNLALDNIKLLGSEAFMQLGATIATELLPYIETALGILESVIVWFTDNSEAILGWVIALGTGLAALNVVIMIQNMVEAFLSFKKVLLGAKSAQDLFNLAMKNNAIGLVVAAIAGLIAGIIYLWKTNEDFRDAILNIWDGIKKGIKGTIDFLMNPIGTIIKNIKEVIKWAGKIGLINSDEEKESKKSKQKKLSGMANGGSISKGTALVGENGPELLTMGFGVAKVTPLGLGGTSDLANEIASKISAKGGDTYNFYSPKALTPSESAKQMKNAQKALMLGF
ncbi:hypothetical protein [Anaerovorax sp. IOR16]|uniref:hypothetical protein n=1 Tax=Anaerovorax sp. IOR16 TaxID=2773458 RepID=UPI0019D20443|nr:hypothetical protein [Anaerovorax sp. IOR16]